MVENSPSGFDGDGNGLPAGSTVKKMQTRARPGPFEACDNVLKGVSGHLPLLEHERIFVIGAADDDSVELHDDPLNWTVEMTKLEEDVQMEAVSEGTSLSTVKGNEILAERSGNIEAIVKNGDEGIVAVVAHTTRNQGGTALFGVNCHPKDVSETVTTRISVTHAPKVVSQLLESKVVDYSNLLLAACAESNIPCACDILKEDNANLPCDVQEFVTPPLVKSNLESNPISRDSLLPPLVNEEQQVPDEGPMAGHESDSDEKSPVPEIPPACAGNPPNNPLPSHHMHETPGVEATRSAEEAAAATLNRKPEPFSLDAGQVKAMGTAGMCEGIPTLRFSERETEFLSEKLGLAIVGKFSHSLPSTHQIQRALGKMDLAGSFT